MNRRRLAALRREVRFEMTFGDQQMMILERRIIALEEVEASRWPRRILVRARLRRDLRESVAGYGWLPDFEARRIQAIGDGWIRPWGQP